jgi:hypothetical protein
MKLNAAFLILAALLVLAPALVSVTAAQNTSGYGLSWYTLDSGGLGAGGGYSLTGALGQPDAGRLAGESYSLSGGFLAGTANLRTIYLPVISKGL